MLNVILDLLTKRLKTERLLSNDPNGLNVDGTVRETIDVLAHYVASMCKFAFLK